MSEITHNEPVSHYSGSSPMLITDKARLYITWVRSYAFPYIYHILSLETSYLYSLTLPTILYERLDLKIA